MGKYAPAKRPLCVKQDESHVDGSSTFWFTVVSPNGATVTTSETYGSRSNAVRAARTFIRLINPVQVQFSYWTGRIGEMVLQQELVR